MTDYNKLILTVENHIAHVVLNRPDKANALSMDMWLEIENVMNEIDQNPEARVVVISGNGKHFCAGIDLMDLMRGLGQIEHKDLARKNEKLRHLVFKLQAAFTAIEKCRIPVIAATHNACVGAGVDMISACDMRYSTKDVKFSIKEIDVGMTADVGTLQRLPHLIPNGIVKEMAYTGRNVNGEEAEKIGLVNKCFDDKETMMTEVMEIAKTIAAKSPISIRGTKEMLLYTRDHSVEDGLKYIATWNAAMLLSKDLEEAFVAKTEGREPKFEN
ncbi:MAG: enoyl-CoA hydratase [bacterium]|jgi:enoyl-CoA hydratase